jgi:predicted nucleotidyltransferase
MTASRTPDGPLKSLLDRLVSIYRPEAVYLFGSRARGEARTDSDYDLLVVVPDDTPRERLNLVSAYEAARSVRVAADVIPCRRSVFEARKEEIGTLPYTAWTEGVRVYGA